MNWKKLLKELSGVQDVEDWWEDKTDPKKAAMAAFSALGAVPSFGALKFGKGLFSGVKVFGGQDVKDELLNVIAKQEFRDTRPGGLKWEHLIHNQKDPDIPINSWFGWDTFHETSNLPTSLANDLMGLEIPDEALEGVTNISFRRAGLGQTSPDPFDGNMPTPGFLKDTGLPSGVRLPIKPTDENLDRLFSPRLDEMDSVRTNTLDDFRLGEIGENNWLKGQRVGPDGPLDDPGGIGLAKEDLVDYMTKAEAPDRWSHLIGTTPEELLLKERVKDTGIPHGLLEEEAQIQWKRGLDTLNEQEWDALLSNLGGFALKGNKDALGKWKDQIDYEKLEEYLKYLPERNYEDLDSYDEIFKPSRFLNWDEKPPPFHGNSPVVPRFTDSNGADYDLQDMLQWHRDAGDAGADSGIGQIFSLGDETFMGFPFEQMRDEFLDPSANPKLRILMEWLRRNMGPQG